MNKHILNTEIQNFIQKNINLDLNAVLLKGTTFKDVSTSEIIHQITAKKRCKKKLPTWYKTKLIYYPDKLNIEQTSSEITAKYKSKLVKGKNLIDLTGGFGVDCFYFSKQVEHVTHCEIKKQLSDIAKYNYSKLNIENISIKNEDGIQYLISSKLKYDWVYVDPSRRHDSKGKVFYLKDCLPDIPKHLDLLFQHSNNILIKTSPLLDISAGINELKAIKNIHIVAVKNEVKELLWHLESGYDNTIHIKTINLKSETTEEIFNFKFDDEKISVSKYSKPLNYLFEPNVAVLKSGAFNQVSAQFDMYKLHQHSHLYTSNTLKDFPGRVFIIEAIVPYNKKAFKTLNITKANVTTRNFPEKVEHIRKKLKIKDGGENYLFFTTDTEDNKIIISCKKV